MLALTMATLLLACGVAQTAFAQTASGGGLSVTVGTSTNDPSVGETFYYGVRVSNTGGSPVSGAVLEVIFPPSFRSQGEVPPSGCTATPLGLSCPLGTLAANETREIFFPGHFDGLDDGDTIARVRDASGTVTVTVERQDNDGDDQARRGRQGPRDLTCPTGQLTLSGGTDPDDPITVDDDLEIFLNGESVFEDNDEFADDIPPFKFAADQGDELRVVASNSTQFGGGMQLDPLYLHCDLTGDFVALDPRGFPRTEGSHGEVFYDETFTIPFRRTPGPPGGG